MNKDKQNKKESFIHGTEGGEMPDSEALRHGDTQEQIKKAFADSDRLKNLKIPEAQGDLADGAEEQIEATLQDEINKAKRPSV